MKKYIAIFLIVFFVAFPVLAQVQTGQPSDDSVQGQIDGKAAASADGLWYAAGCFFGCCGILGAYLLSNASPPMSALAGKSQAYISAYTEAYKERKRTLDTINAAKGSLALVGTILTLYLVSLVAKM